MTKTGDIEKLLTPRLYGFSQNRLHGTYHTSQSVIWRDIPRASDSIFMSHSRVKI